METWVAMFFDLIDLRLQAFIAEQKMFFVATAPRQGRISLSPKGMDTFRCLSPNRVAYLDFTGSGNETAAHLLDDGRLTVMFCCFGSKPNILRLYGQGRTVQRDDADWAELAALFELLPGVRQIIVQEVDSVQTSCGFGVPLFDWVGERDTLRRSCEAKGEQGMADYQRQKNQISIDGLPTGLVVEEVEG